MYNCFKLTDEDFGGRGDPESTGAGSSSILSEVLSDIGLGRMESATRTSSSPGGQSMRFFVQNFGVKRKLSKNPKKL
jgi:hypothetical protein